MISSDTGVVTQLHWGSLQGEFANSKPFFASGLCLRCYFWNLLLYPLSVLSLHVDLLMMCDNGEIMVDEDHGSKWVLKALCGTDSDGKKGFWTFL